MTFARFTSLAVAVSSIALVAGCAQSETSLKNEWSALSMDWAARTASLGKEAAALAVKVAALPKDAPGRASIDAAVKADQEAVVALSADYTNLKKEADEIFEHGTHEGIVESVERLKSLSASAAELDETIAEESRLLSEAKERSEKAAMEAANAAKAAAAVGTARTALLAKIAKEGGAAEVAGVLFAGEKADLAVDQPSVVAALDALVAFAGTCDDLRFELKVQQAAGSDAKRAEALATERAVALKKYLVEHKVDASKLKAATGGVGTDTPVSVNVVKKCG
jgi:hypothetical protein